MASPILETHALTRRYGSLTAVDNLTLSVAEGEIFGLLGPNGAGKTTTLKMLTTLLPPTSGDAKIAGHDIVHQAREVRRLIWYVPQMLSADGTLSGYENLDIFGKLYDIPRAERRKRVSDALEFMGLADSSNKLVRDYSGGMIRRLEVAQSFLHHPRVLFLDEPTAGIDVQSKIVILDFLHEINKKGTTIIYTSHYMEEAENLCSRVAIIDRGIIISTGNPKNLIADHPEFLNLENLYLHLTGKGLRD